MSLPYLNLGCGTHYHTAWVNIDFFSSSEYVIAHNLLKGIPANDDSFEVVYHSHILEHFTVNEGQAFLSECYRVLKKGGILRIAVPDLERIVNEYKRILSELRSERPADPSLSACYDWILLELYDQAIRHKPGGAMLSFLEQDQIINRDYLLERCGHEVKNILDQKNSDLPGPKRNLWKALHPSNLYYRLRMKMIRLLLGNDYTYYQIGRFRKSGEIHQWMYDEWSLTMLLEKTGFKDICTKNAFESSIADWTSYGLDNIGDRTRKPDSLFMEAVK